MNRKRELIRKPDKVSDIRLTEIKKTCKVGKKTVSVRIQYGRTGIVNGGRVILDEDMVDGMADGIVDALRQNATSYNPLPDEVIVRNDAFEGHEPQDEKAEKEEPISEKEVFESYEPRFSLEQVALNDDVRARIKTAISAVRYRRKMSDEWGMSGHFAGNRAVILNFYGKSGTGKSMAAEAIAQALEKKVYRIDYSELESKYVGETPKNIRKAFEMATRDDAVLIFDEADSFLGKRLTSVTQSADYGVNITRSVLLMELEKFSGVVVFTTNLISNYDEAFKRRILLSVYFEMPGLEARTDIWRLHLSEKMPLGEGVTPEALAERYDGLSGADIRDMVFYAALHALEAGLGSVSFDDFDRAKEALMERYENHGDGGFTVVSTETITEEEYRKETRES